ncbi:uncharacterized protein LOC120670877 isoform X2 [Panicum virgatum]|uniref:uncharacterized protein LOC120670877 isoform X2 n=1 Tax=Panicum virgatum TaxID=38727 RepID=UPI0019D530B5|nr:uncharacterized protein LOC120670877 isoform X2 [Panicum virgatum]
MDLVCHGRAGFFPVGGDDDGVKLLFLLLLSVGVGSGEDRRWMDLLQAGVGSGVFGGAGSGAPSVRSGNGEGGIVGSGDDLVRSAHPHHRRGWGGLDAWKAEDRWAGVVWPAPAPEKRGVCP